ncbi:MAG: Nramp family divalent metal transporter [Alphaproteobacteria bacterium]
MKKKKSLPPKKSFLSILGPGLITGAADDDPSGIATYSITGAQYGTSFLWLTWFTWPLMAAVQMMCARIGLITGHGLARALSHKFPRPILIFFCCLLLLANTINIAADFVGMADAAEMLSGVDSKIAVVVFAIGIGYSIVMFRYHQIANVLKWLSFALFAYIAVPFMLEPNWLDIVKKSFTITLPQDEEGWETVVAILGTTISPYLFFWQASQEVEETEARGLHGDDPRVQKIVLKERAIDVTAGTFLSNIVMFFIILSTALALNAHGVTKITTSREAAEALKPLGGEWAVIFYTVGLISVGLLAIPTLAGSSAYAFAEVFGHHKGLNNKLNQAKFFYGVIIFSIACGVIFTFLNINPIRALYWSAVINGVLAPFILLGMLAVSMDNKLMKNRSTSKLGKMAVWVATGLMTAAGFAFLIH